MTYKKFTGIILKKHNYKEADQIVTVWTKELGKVRFLAKSCRKAESKLNFALQDLGVIEFEVTGRHLPVLISARLIKNYKSIKTDLNKTALAFYASELMLKITADEHPNAVVYEALELYLTNLNKSSKSRTIRYSGKEEYILLSSFCLELLDCLGFKSELPKNNFNDIHKFVEYILERKINSQPFLVSL